MGKITALPVVTSIDANDVAVIVVDGVTSQIASDNLAASSAFGERYESGALVDDTPVIVYVSPDGDDDNDGLTASRPKATVTSAYAALPDAVTYGQGGGEIRMLAGIHTSPFEIEVDGVTANKPFTLTGAGIGRTIWRRASNIVLLKLAGVENSAGSPIEYVSEVTIRDMTIDGNASSANLVELLEVNHVIFQSVRFYRVAGSGVYGRAVFNSKFQYCRFSNLGTTDPSNVAGVEMVNNTAVDTNGVRFESCDFEVTLSGRDVHLLGDVTRRLTNVVFYNCKFESAPESVGYAPSQRVFLERCDDIVFDICKFIRGLNTQLDLSLCLNTRVTGCEFFDGQGTYALHFQDGSGHIVDNCVFYGSDTQSAHLRIGGTANVRVGVTQHTVVDGELTIDDQSTVSVFTETTAGAAEKAQLVPLVTSRYYRLPNGTLATASATTGALRLTPVWIPEDCTLVRLGADVAVAGGAGSLFRMGVYADDGNFRPNMASLLLDAGTIDGTSATVQEKTVSLALTRGWYWFAGVGQVAAPTMRIVVPSGYGAQRLDYGTTLPISNSSSFGWQTSAGAGALPTSGTLAVSGTAFALTGRLDV